MSILQSPYFWLIVFGVVIFAAFILMKKGKHSNWGFRDILKNPDYWDNVSGAFQEADAAAEAAKSWDDEKVAAMVWQFLFEVSSSHEAWYETRIMRALGQRTHSNTLDILEDQSLYRRLVKPTGTSILPEAPFNRACDLLEESPPSRAVDAVAPFLDDSSTEIRKDAARVIAGTGDRHIVPLMRKAFEDVDEYVCSFALMGLKSALNDERLDKDVAEELFPDIRQLLETDKKADIAASILYCLDPQRATQFFLSAEVFSADSRIIHRVLRTLVEAKAAVPRDQLQQLIVSLESSKLEYPREYALSEALRLLGQFELPEDREFLNERTTHDETLVAEGAVEGLLYSYKMEGFKERIWEVEEESGYESLSIHQRYFNSVFICDAEINNGGLSQYFVNSSGDHWRDAVAGLEAMGSSERLEILKEAIAVFGDAGPSEEREERQHQLSKLVKRNEEVFDELDSRYYDSSEVVEVLSSRFVLANSERFR